jgi:hypothetical protein
MNNTTNAARSALQIWLSVLLTAVAAGALAAPSVTHSDGGPARHVLEAIDGSDGTAAHRRLRDMYSER